MTDKQNQSIKEAIAVDSETNLVTCDSVESAMNLSNQGAACLRIDEKIGTDSSLESSSDSTSLKSGGGRI